MSTQLMATADQVLAVTEAQKAILTQKTPAEVIRYREGPSGMMLAYVEHAWVNEQLNLAFNWAWSWEILEWRFVPESDPLEVFVLGRLTVHTPHGDLIKTQFGSAEVKRARKTGLPLSIGDDLKAASSDALKKASSLLGLALDLYRSDDEKPDQNGNGHAEGNSRVRADPMTAFWLAVKEREMGRDEGRTLLERAGGDPAQALTLLDS
jgi:hypothetical protein